MEDKTAADLIKRYHQRYADEFCTPERNSLVRQKDKLKAILALINSSTTLLASDSQRNQRIYFGSITRILRPWAESGGRAGEALTMLQGLGLLIDFPKTEIVENSKFIAYHLSEKFPPPGSIEISKQNTPSTATITSTICFSAYLPDDQGRETWQQAPSWAEESFVEAKMVLTIPLDTIGKIKETLQTDYEQTVQRLGV
jgi:hypothetical protein